jgi:hypothetical protein
MSICNLIFAKNLHVKVVGLGAEVTSDQTQCPCRSGLTTYFNIVSQALGKVVVERDMIRINNRGND